jgi:hypothetical protein
MPLHPSMAASDVVLLQSTRWDLHAWFVSKGMQTMGSWVDQPFVSDSMLREYEVDARAALFEVMHAFPSTKLWGLVIAPPGVLSKAKSDAPFLQATLNARAQTAVKDVLKSAAADFGMVLVDWGGMIESAGQAVECEFGVAVAHYAQFCLNLLARSHFHFRAGSLDGSHVSTDCFLPFMSTACDAIHCLLDSKHTSKQ